MPPVPEILWAEDNRQDRAFIQECLQVLPTRPDVALVDDGVALLDALAKGTPTLVVLDLKMPRLGGIDAMREMRANPAWKHVPVVIFSSGNRPQELAQCVALGARAFVEKPVDFDLFASAVARVVAMHADGPPPAAPPPALA